ncbi:hypothetical protein WJX74_000855 [Apatococcus lobatus]|uniref:Zeta toxin domain-containing protein n=1 Tax=Apatococcus lobatus TaxID=904363 RepID=A0AAW1Q179_9CHLO
MLIVMNPKSAQRIICIKGLMKVFDLNELLFSVARFERTFSTGASEAHSHLPRCVSSQGSLCSNEVDMNREAEQHLQQHAADLESVRAVASGLMNELEAILHEYLSFNWDRVEEVLDSNRTVLKGVGLSVPWPSHASLSSLANASGELNWSGELSQELSQAAQQQQPQISSRPSSDSLNRPSPGRLLPLAGGLRSSATSNGQLRKARSGKEIGRQRAVANWKRARNAATKKVTIEMLGAQRRFQTLYEMFAELNQHSSAMDENRSPILLLLGGGMAAGKSTVREIIGHDEFWSKVGKNAVVVEADAIKTRDIVFKQLAKQFESDASLSQFVHEYSTKAAESMLVAALNQQKDIVFDGTMTWSPFVEQTIGMARDYRNNYRRSVGYVEHENGHVTERYWEIDPENPIQTDRKRPYRIELVGVTCDAGLAVARGIWRKLRTGRSVPVSAQLRSHRLFSDNFEHIAHLVDSATLYHTGAALTTFNKAHVDLSPQIIAHRSTATRGQMLVNPPFWAEFKHKSTINDKATCRNELHHKRGAKEERFPRSQPGSMSTLRQAFRLADRRERILREKPAQSLSDVIAPLLDKLHRLDTVHSRTSSTSSERSGHFGRPPHPPLLSRLSQQSDPDRPPSPRSIHPG